jgi:hypothetical protein
MSTTNFQISRDHSINDQSGMNTKLFFTLLLCVQILLIFQGLELADTGFYATFYQQIFTDPQSVAYCFMFWLSGIIGGIFLKLFPYSGLFGLRLLWVLIYILIIISTYRLLRKYVRKEYLQWSLFILTLYLNNDPKEFYYNNFSSLLYVITAILLFNGLKSNRLSAIFGSGVIVSLNSFNRFPNILGIGLVLAILYYGYIYKAEIRTVVKYVFCFLAGFLITTAVVLLIMKRMGHLQIYLDALYILMGMGKKQAQINPAEDHYSIILMTKTIIHHFGVTVIVAALISSGLIILCTIENKMKSLIPRINIILVLIKICIVLIVVVLVFRGNITHISINNVITGVSLIAGASIILFGSNKELNLLLFIGIFIMIVHPMGSSEGIRTVEKYSLWITFPIVFDRIFSMRSIKYNADYLKSGGIKGIHVLVTEHQLREIKKTVLVLSIFSCLYFTYYYPHADWQDRKNMYYAVDNNKMRFIFTSRERAELLDQLLVASSRYVKSGDYVIAFDCIPLFHYMTDTKPYVRNPMPWLYLSNTFKRELESAEMSKNKLPVIIMQTASTLVDQAYAWPKDKSPADYLQNPINIERNKILENFIADHNYHEVWSNSYFKILVPPGKNM